MVMFKQRKHARMPRHAKLKMVSKLAMISFTTNISGPQLFKNVLFLSELWILGFGGAINPPLLPLTKKDVGVW